MRKGLNSNVDFPISTDDNYLTDGQQFLLEHLEKRFMKHIKSLECYDLE